MKKKTKIRSVSREQMTEKSVDDNNSEIVLLAVTGMSPSVLTETVWALAHPIPGDDSKPIIPNRVVVLTTSRGRDEIIRLLFSPNPILGGKNAWESLRESLGKEGFPVKDKLRFGKTGDDIRVFTKPNSETNETFELDDIRTPEDNEAAANFILENLRGFVDDPEKQVIGSIAGGRKTMSALLYACFSLVGRDIDKLTHVLVNEPYDQLKDFFFPAQPTGSISHRDGGKFNPAEANIQLADIPFPNLRYLFSREFGRQTGGFMRLVESCNANVKRRIGESIRLTISRNMREIEVNGQRLQLSAREHCIMLFLASRAKDGEPSFGIYKDGIDVFNEFRKGLVETAPKENLADWRFSDAIRKDFSEEDLRKCLSSIREKVRRCGGDIANLALVLPERGMLGLQIPPSLIYIK
jgi:CRISPR-associated protein (TIGR02584 family)